MSQEVSVASGTSSTQYLSGTSNNRHFRSATAVASAVLLSAVPWCRGEQLQTGTCLDPCMVELVPPTAHAAARDGGCSPSCGVDVQCPDARSSRRKRDATKRHAQQLLSVHWVVWADISCVCSTSSKSAVIEVAMPVVDPELRWVQQDGTGISSRCVVHCILLTVCKPPNPSNCCAAGLHL